MSRQKGNALCHTYTNIGRHNHEQMIWESNKNSKCDHHRNIGKRGICMVEKSVDCKTGDINKCQLSLLQRKCVYLDTGVISLCRYDQTTRICDQLVTPVTEFKCPIGKLSVAPE